MAQSDGAAVDVDLAHVKVQLAGHGDGLGGKGLVGLDQVDVVDGDAGLLHGVAGSDHGADAHDLGIHAALAPADQLGHGLQTVLGHSLAGGQHDGGSAVVDAGGVGGGNALGALIGSILAAGGLEGVDHHGVGGLGAHGERALQLGDAVRGDTGLGILILGEGNHFLLDLDHHGDDLVIEPAGGLGVEIDFTELPGIQKTIIDRSFSFGKPIVTATQMLDSMIVNPRPTRAEISDVANAIYDGTSAIMLSGETAAGAYPVDALKTMSAIAERTEQENHARFVPLAENTGKISVSDATAHAACLTAKDVNAAAIVTVSESGTTARLLSKYRPKQPIIACVMDEQVQRQLSLSWGITSLLMGPAHSTDELIEMSTALAEKNGYLHNGELAVVTAGVPVGVSGTTNMIKIHMVGNCLATGVGVGRGKTDLVSASGKACVCRTLEEVKAKFRPGMVLVVPSTTNEMLGYVRDAAALVVEEPGLNSHAAIVGNSLLKPTIVGAAGACSHIRDGLDIAVDCAHGSVQRLQA